MKSLDYQELDMHYWQHPTTSNTKALYAIANGRPGVVAHLLVFGIFDYVSDD